MIVIPEHDTSIDPQWLDVSGLTYDHRARFGQDRGVAVLRSAESAFSPHAHGGHRVNLLLRGHDREWCRGAFHEAGPGSITLVPAGEVHHSPKSHGSTHYLCLAFPDEQPLLSAEHELSVAAATPLVWRLYEATRAEPDPLHVEALHTEVEGAISRLRFPLDSDADWMRTAIERILDDPTSLQSVAELARSVGVHRCHLARTARARFGRSVGELVTLRKLQLAGQRLAVTDDPIAEIAAATGFFDQSHLGRCFRKRFGTTPAAFRRRFA